MNGLWLATGTRALTSAVNLLDDKGLSILTKSMRLDVVDRRSAPVQVSAWGETRKLTLGLWILGGAMPGSADALLQNIRTLEAKLDEAEKARGQNGVWKGTPVSLWWQMLAAQNFTYWDVVYGAFDLPETEFFGNAIDATLVLYLDLYGRGDPVALPVSGTLINGIDTVYLPNIPGDVDALAQVTLTDVSPAGALSPPTGLAVTTSPTGGSIGPSVTLGYRIATEGATGTLTLPCTEVTATTPADALSTHTATPTWQAAAGATGYSVYGRTSAAELLLARVGPGVLSWTDTGVSTPTGAMPVSNTSKQVITAVHLGRMSAPGLLATDFSPFVSATPVVPSQLSISLGAASAGTFTVTLGANTTASLPFNATPYQLQLALQALASLGSGNMTVSGSGTDADPWILTYAGTLGTTPQNQTFTVTPTGLTGGTVATQRLTGVSFSDITAVGGAYVRSTAQSQYWPAANYAQPTGAYQTGAMDTWVRARNNATSGGGVSPDFSGFAASNGAGFQEPYRFLLYEIDVAGGFSPPSTELRFGVSFAFLQANLSWTANGSYAKARLYAIAESTQNAGGSWSYLDNLPTSGSTTVVSTSTWTVGNPPSVSAATNALLLPFIGVATPNGINTDFVEGYPVPTQLQGRPEYVYLGVITYAPIATSEAGVAQAALLQIHQASASTNGTPLTVDLDNLVRLPHDEPQLHARRGNADDVAQRAWVLDTRRDLRASGYLSDGSNTQGQVSVTGRFTLHRGNNIVTPWVECFGGISDETNARFTIQITYTPRYLLPRGLAT